jgi:hypothetical protein
MVPRTAGRRRGSQAHSWSAHSWPAALRVADQQFGVEADAVAVEGVAVVETDPDGAGLAGVAWRVLGFASCVPACARRGFCGPDGSVNQWRLNFWMHRQGAKTAETRTNTGMHYIGAVCGWRSEQHDVELLLP